MKRFFSSPVPTFTAWMTLCTVGATMVGLPTPAIAQDALTTPSTTGALHASRPKIYVHNTKWIVEYAENGRNGDYHPVPWQFMPDGTVRAGHLWHGTWHIESHDTVRVVIKMNNHSATDKFYVKFKNSSEFTAYKHGHPYRYAVRQHSSH